MQMNRPSPRPETFQETFCAQYCVQRDVFGPTVLRLTLYPHARFLAGMPSTEFLAPDRHFILCVGQVRLWREFSSEAFEFQHLPENRRFRRRRLRLRVSIGRMRALFSEVMGGGTKPLAVALG